MSKFIGRKTEVGIGKESPRGTRVEPAYWIGKNSLTFDDKVTLTKSGESIGSIASQTTGFITEAFADGTLEAEVRDKTFGLILLATLGAESSANIETTAYRHTYTLLNTNQHPSLTIGYKDDIGSIAYGKAMVSGLTLNVTMEDIVNFSVNFTARQGDTIGAYTPSYGAENKFTKKHFSFYVDDTLTGLDTATQVDLKEFTLNIEKPIIMDRKLGTIEPEDILNSSFSITGTIVLNYENRTFKNYALNGDVKAVRIDLTNTDRTIGAATNPRFRMDLGKVIFEEWDADKSLDDIVSQTLNFTAYANNSGALWNSCILENEVNADY